MGRNDSENGSRRLGASALKTKRKKSPVVLRAELYLWRTKLGWTQKQAAAWLEVMLRTYENWEQGRPVEQPGPIKKLMEQARKENSRL